MLEGHEFGQEAIDLLEPPPNEFSLIFPVEPVIHTPHYAIGIVTHVKFPDQQFVIAVLPGIVEGESVTLIGGIRRIDKSENNSSNSLLSLYHAIKEQDLSHYDSLRLFYPNNHPDHDARVANFIGYAISAPDTIQFEQYLLDSGSNSDLNEIDSI